MSISQRSWWELDAASSGYNWKRIPASKSEGMQTCEGKAVLD